MKRKITRLMIMTLLLAAHTSSFIKPASAEIVQNNRTTINFSFYLDCTNEVVVGTAQIHTIWIINAGKIDSIHYNLNGTAVGQTTGNRYKYMENYKDDFTTYFCGSTTYAQIHMRWISQGKAPNLDVNFLQIWEFDQDCNPLSPTFSVVSTRCK